jgi:hypothetical protein
MAGPFAGRITGGRSRGRLGRVCHEGRAAAMVTAAQTAEVAGTAGDIVLMGATGSHRAGHHPVRETRFWQPPAGEHCFALER